MARVNSAVVLASAALLTLGLFFISDADFPSSECAVLSDWWASTRFAISGGSQKLELPADLRAQHQVEALTLSALRSSGWRSGVKFARVVNATLEAALAAPTHHTGALLLVLPGDEPPTKRGLRPFLSLAPGAANLSAVLPVSALNLAVAAVETARGRQLFSFRLDARPLPSCTGGEGPCAVWEVSSGRVVLDAGLVGRIGAVPQLGSLLQQFTGELFSQAQAAAGRQGADQASTIGALSNLFAAAGPAALAVLLAAAGGLPLWWCIACPVVLGMLAPFVFNFGLTAAAEQICQHFQMPDDQCADLWWGAFALALVLSLASAIPIVLVCRLPECGKHLTRGF